MAAHLQESAVLANGVKIPVLGMGTSHDGGYSQEAVVYALNKCDYRHIDTAKLYKTEPNVAESIKASNVPREDIFITTKLWPTDFGKSQEAFKLSLKKLQTDYVDLYLIHHPSCPPNVQDQRALRLETWRELEKLYDSGQCKAIGVSNYEIEHLEEILESGECSGMMPHVNQFENHPYYNHTDLIKYCRGKGIVVEGYCPIARGAVLKEPILLQIAKKHNKTAAQVSLKWSLQNDIVILPKTTKKARVKENCEVFDFTLSNEDMKAIDSLHRDEQILSFDAATSFIKHYYESLKNSE